MGRWVAIPLLPLAALACACGGAATSSSASPGAWDEQSMCRGPWARVTVVDERQRPIDGALVWTAARMREGGSGFGETWGGDVVREGPATRTDREGRVLFCDVTRALVAAYGHGRLEEGWGGRSWASVLAVELFVEVGTRVHRVPRFASSAWGTGGELALPAVVVVPADVASAEPLPHPTVDRPSPLR